MSISCPNKRLKIWKDLVQQVGENKAYLLWTEYDGNVPDDYYVNTVLENVEEDVSLKETPLTLFKQEDFSSVIDDNIKDAVFTQSTSENRITDLALKNNIESKTMLFGDENTNTISASDALLNLINNNSFEQSENTSFFLNQARKLLNKSGATLKFIDEKHPAYKEFSNNTVMLYDSIDNTIYVIQDSLNQFTKEDIVSAFIHEVVHSVTVKAYFAPLTYEEREFKKLIDDAYDKYKFLSTKRDSKGNLSYGFTNQAEFIAEIFSNPQFRAEIQSIEKNFFQKFVDAVRRILELVRNGFNNDLVSSAILFQAVEDIAVSGKYARWKGTLVDDPRYNIFEKRFLEKVEKPKSATIDDKINNLIDSQLNNIDNILKRAISKNKDGKNERFINRVKELNTDFTKTAELNKLAAINQYADFMVEQIASIYRKIEKPDNKLLNTLEGIDSYKSYLGASDMLKPIMDSLNDVRIKNLSQEQKDIVQEIQSKLRAVSFEHETINSKFRAHTTAIIQNELKSSYYSENAVKRFREKVAKDYPANSTLTKKEWINQQVIERQDELNEFVENDINEVIGGLSTDVDGFDKSLLSMLNTKSRLIQVVAKVIAKMKSKIDSIVSNHDFTLDKLYKDLVAEKGKYDVTNLYETTSDGEVFVKGEYSLKYRKKYLNEYSKWFDDLNALKEKYRDQGVEEIDIAFEPDVIALNKKLIDWKKENTIKNGTKFFPHPKYKNNLKLSKAEEAIRKHFISLAKDSDKTFGKNNSLIKRSFGAEYYSLPYATVSNLERVVTGRVNVKDSVKQKVSEFTDWKIDDLENNSEEMYRQDGTRIFNIPVMYRNNVSKTKEPEKFKQLLKEQSFDLLTLMRLEHYNQTNFKVKSENEQLLNAFVDISRDKKYLKTKPGTNNLVSNIFGVNTKYVTKPGEESNEYKRLQSIINQSLYNKFYEESFKIIGKDVNKIVQSVNRHTSFLGMTTNYFNAPVNILNAEFQTFLLKIGGDINSGTLRSAHLEYAKDLPNIIADAGRPNKLSFVNQLNLLTDVFGGLTHEQNDFIKNNMLKGVTDPQMLQILQTGGEHMVQSVLNMALLKSIKVMNDKAQYINKEGKVVSEKEAASLFDMLEQNPDTKQLNFSNKFTYTDKSSVTKWNEGGLENVRLFIKKKIFDSMGEYDKNFQTEIQRHWWGQLIMMYKKFIIPLGLARYRGGNKMLAKRENLTEDDKHWNEALQEYEEGFYTTTFRFIARGLVQNLVKLKFSIISQNWNELSDYEKSNIKKGVVELGVLTLLQAVIVPLIVGAAHDDDDDDLMYLAMIARRLEQELSFYTDPNDAYKVTKNPIASMTLIEDFINVLRFTISPGLWFSETKDGTPRAYKVIEKVAIPSTWRPGKDSEEVLKNMNRNLLAPYEESMFYRLVNE